MAKAEQDLKRIDFSKRCPHGNPAGSFCKRCEEEKQPPLVATAESALPTELQLDERERLSELEDTVDRGLASFVEVGSALMEIRDSRLYRETYPTFEDYCRERWSMTRRHANRTIEAAHVAELVGPIGPIPANEAQARELVPLSDQPEVIAEVLAEAAAGGEPTAAKIREAVQRKLGVHFSSETSEWATPQDLFDALDSEFGFTLDVCATAENAKCEAFFSLADDGLAQDWAGVCWMNPPYGDAIGAWVKKARESAEAGATVVCLVPARTDTAWWWDNCRDGEVRFIRGRIKFGEAGGAPFPSAVVVFGRPPNIPESAWWER